MEQSKQHQFSARAGFSLVELLVVMAIIITLMGIALGVAGVAQRNAAEAKARGELAKMTLELEHYRSDTGVYPNNLQTLVTWYVNERYVGSDWDLTPLSGTNIPVDPWGRNYSYTLLNSNIFRIFSTGPAGGGTPQDNISISQ